MVFVDPLALPEREPKPGWRGRFFHSGRMTFAYYRIEAGGALPLHAHENEEIWNIVAGEVEMTVGDETRVLTCGQAAIVPSGVVHAVVVKRDTYAIVVDSPRRGSVGGIQI